MLYFVPTPIGNLADISYHALEILQKSEIILCEDTRVGKKLLSLLSSKFDINFGEKSFFSVHSHNETAFLSQIDTQILREKDCVFMSDAGMPCICDPGREVVNFALKNDIKYEILFIGAEGGFSQHERAKIKRKFGLNSPNILRSNTAIISVCAKKLL